MKVFFVIFLTISLASVFSAELKRSKRTLVYPRGSVITFIVAIAVPLDLPNRSVFNSFNFAANYGVPTNVTHYTRVPARFPFTEARSKRSIITRRWFYRMASNYLTRLGLNGTGCLLRAICEVSESPLDDGNGLHGDLLQIILTPSSSIDENLPKAFQEAEIKGRMQNCNDYINNCPKSVLDMISY